MFTHARALPRFVAGHGCRSNSIRRENLSAGFGILLGVGGDPLSRVDVSSSLGADDELFRWPCFVTRRGRAQHRALIPGANVLPHLLVGPAFVFVGTPWGQAWAWARQGSTRHRWLLASGV